MKISSHFDGGNIDCLDCTDANNIRLQIRADNNSEFYQWFYFRLSGARDQACTLHLENAGGAAYTGGWQDYKAVASYDREHWFRIPTSYQDGQLQIHCTPEYDSLYIAYFAPYSLERHANLLAECQHSPRASLQNAGQTLDGRDIDIIRVDSDDAQTDDNSKRVFWVIARQHPGETMAEWWVEGFIDRLLDPDDPVSRALLQRASFRIVPNMNPDGSYRGHLRTNAVGANLNREWQDASIERSPEVFYVREAMRESGVDLCFDVHGDEALPYNFIAGTEGVANWNESRQSVLDSFKQQLATLNPDFQTEHGYPPNAPGKANLSLCSNHVAQYFNCLAMTLEMPFKDSAISPNEVTGWSPERCRLLGASCLQAMLNIEPELSVFS